jgi:hypothetical protein
MTRRWSNSFACKTCGKKIKWNEKIIHQRGNIDDEMSKGMSCYLMSARWRKMKLSAWWRDDAWNALDGAKMTLCKSRPKSYGQKEQSRQRNPKTESKQLAEHHLRMGW